MKGSWFYTPAIGMQFSAWLRLLTKNARGHIPLRYWPRVVGTSLIVLLSWPFQRWEEFRLRARINTLELDDNPVFIIGHWRSGTTHLHNLLSRDQRFGFVTTLQGVLPHSFQTNALFPRLMSWLMPPKRPMDDMAIHSDSPQEEDIALLGYESSSLYSMWCFPERTRSFYDRSVEFEGMDSDALADWTSNYLELLKKAALYSGKHRLLLKNPANTGRIPVLLKLFPNARFIFIYRDPLEVYSSTKKLHSKVWPLYNLQNVNVERLNSDILYIYKHIMKKYLIDRPLIPEGHLVEVAYSDLVNRPMHVLEQIYRSLGLGWTEEVSSNIEAHLANEGTYTPSEYFFSEEEKSALDREFKFAIDLWSKSAAQNNSQKDPEGLDPCGHR